jgi:hypothetical protein
MPEEKMSDELELPELSMDQKAQIDELMRMIGLPPQKMPNC